MAFEKEVREEQAILSPDLGPTMAPSRLADPAPLAMGGFATTLLTVSLAMMNFRGVTVQTMFVGNLCFVACVGLLISAQWFMIKGDTFSYTVLTAFGLFYGGYGAVMIPWFGVVDAYGGYTPEFYNAYGFFILIWGVLNIFFLIASLRLNVVYVLVFSMIEFCLVIDGVSQFVKADGYDETYMKMQKAAGAFGFIAGLLGTTSTQVVNSATRGIVYAPQVVLIQGSTSSVGNSSGNASQGMSSGAKAALGVSVPLGLIAMAILAFILLRRRRRKLKDAADTQAEPDGGTDDATKVELEGAAGVIAPAGGAELDAGGSTEIVSELPSHASFTSDGHRLSELAGSAGAIGGFLGGIQELPGDPVPEPARPVAREPSESEAFDARPPSGNEGTIESTNVSNVVQPAESTAEPKSANESSDIQPAVATPESDCKDLEDMEPLANLAKSSAASESSASPVQD
ncbi:hypothetical protein O9K51_04838 [Purpureocillium lavendulum]|uniref:Uncharacterized protein n=1 Tax=Purpureocillium lavendulum TaxID=1247861 RepID=A0AB34FXN8_9HYPO|nr:hypothetical protein O9K51_04838 [Purpureocillium lavendulum]